jgi:signal transduction histidine kinase/AraC-like DNA-binding protein
VYGSLQRILATSDIAKVKSLAYDGLNQPKKALAFHKEFKFLQDSIGAVQKEQQFLQANFRLKKDQELQQLAQANLTQELENEKSEKELQLMVVAAIVLMILGIFSVYYFKSKKNLKTELALEHERNVSHMKNNLIENLSHEFRTPLTIMLGYLDLIQTNSTHPERISNHAKIAAKNGNKLIQNLNNLLTLLRSDQKSALPPGVKKSLNMGGYFNESVHNFTSVAQMNSVKLYYQTNLLDNDTTIEFAYDHLTKILNNLISNAIKFSRSGGSVYVSCILAQEHLEISVKDDGIGISKEDLTKVFDRFYQSEHQLHSGGFGIGLSLVKNLTDQLQGTIDVKSEQNVGTHFSLSIPLLVENRSLYTTKRSSDYREISYSDSTLTQEENTNTANLPKALILEDHMEMSNYFKEVLTPYVHCTWVRNGKEGLKKLEQQQFDIIISDLKMPVMNGFEFKAALNKLEHHKNTPYLMVSASPIDFKVEERTQLQINEYMMKPFTDRELISRIQLLLETNIYTEKVLNLDEENAIHFEGSFSKFMDKINKIVLENLHNEDFSVKMLASQCGYSDRHFSRLVRSKVSLTPVKLILEIKLLKAYELLKNRSYQTISEVVYESGFNDRSYFYRAFSKRFGIKPSELNGFTRVPTLDVS